MRGPASACSGATTSGHEPPPAAIPFRPLSNGENTVYGCPVCAETMPEIEIPPMTWAMTP